MKPNYSISIPKPCHEDWSKMTKNEKGRFCKSCCKTVIDFTTMNTSEIQDYIHHNKNKRICGHIKQSQLEPINLKIPETIFNKTWNFPRHFLLALLLAMGTTLFNCSNTNGKKQKINSIEIVEQHKNSIDTILKNNKDRDVKLDSILATKTQKIKPKAEYEIFEEGMMVIETVGDIEVIPLEIEDLESITIDSLEIKTPPHCPGPEDEEIVFGFFVIENPPELINTPDSLSKSEKKNYLTERISHIVTENFNIEIAENLGLKGKQKIYTQFVINKKGVVDNIKTRANHKTLENEALRVIKLLPLFKPATHQQENVNMTYTLPIVFMIED